MTLDTLLEAIAEAGPASAVDLVAAARIGLLRDPGVPDALLDRLDAPEAEAAQTVLRGLLNEARMEEEKASGNGAPFFAALEAALRRRIAADALSEATGGAVAISYAQARLEVPDSLIAWRVALLDASAAETPPSPKEFANMVRGLLREAQADPHAMYEGFRESMADAPVEARAMVVNALATTDAPASGAVAAYFLLDPLPALREAAALATRQRARGGRCDPVLLRRLPMLRSWMPADAARAILDEALREARRRGLASAPAPRPAKAAPRAFATLPDGVGAQTFMVAVGRRVAMLLTKEGFGLTDAYVMFLDSDRELTKLLAEFDTLSPHPASLDKVAVALAAALADGLAQGLPPASGLVDVAELLGLDGLRPEPMDARDWLLRVDPDGVVASLAPRQRTALLARSADLMFDEAIVESWFDDSAALRARLDAAGSDKAAIAAVRAHLDGRREAWALCFLKAAWALGPPGSEAARPIVAAALALLDGTPLRRIAIMEEIAEISLEAYAYAAETGPDEGDVPDAAAAGWAEHAASPETLARLLDGFLTAVVVAPLMAPFAHWVALLANLAGLGGDDADELQATLDPIIARHNAIAGGFIAGDPDPFLPADLFGPEAEAWAGGFIDAVAGLEQTWPARSLTKTDERMLHRLQRIADGEGIGGSPVDLRRWLERRVAKRR